MYHEWVLDLDFNIVIVRLMMNSVLKKKKKRIKGNAVKPENRPLDKWASALTVCKTNHQLKANGSTNKRDNTQSLKFTYCIQHQMCYIEICLLLLCLPYHSNLYFIYLFFFIHFSSCFILIFYDFWGQ